jgi:hypothetical protein
MMLTPTALELGAIESSIKKLESTGGWREWIQAITDVIRICGFGDLLKRNKEEPTQRTDESESDLKARIDLWESRQEQIIAFILSQLGVYARSKVKHIKTLCLILETLKQIFKPQNSIAFLELDNEYRGLTLDKCINITDYAEKLTIVRKELEQLDALCYISEPIFVNKFLTGLGSNYDHFSSAFYTTHNLLPERQGDKITKAAVTIDEAVMAAEQ